MKPVNTLAQMAALRRNLEESARGEYKVQQVCPSDQTDRARGFQTHTDRANVDKTLNFDQEVYMFPPAYNALRKEIYENWQDTIWPMVAWRMAFRAEEFTEYMNAITGLALAVDSDCVDWTCEQYLRRLKQMRGLSGN